jgi:hypothetical protein
MSISEAPAPERPGAAHAALVALLVVANIGLAAFGARLSGARFGSDSAESPINPPRAPRRLDARAVLRNADYLGWLCDRVRDHRGILFFGTSESGPVHNLGAQLNDVRPGDPPLTVLPVKGMSPIHSTLVFARSRREGMPLPPTILVINLVYFTESHDVIDDGWLSTVVRSPVFMQFDHGGLRQQLSAEVRDVFDSHFRGRSVLAPLLYQQYVGNLMYLKNHPATPGVLPPDSPPPERYHFDGTVPVYDRERNVPRGYMPSDQLSKGRWRVRSESECVNLKGVENTARLLRDESAPALLVVLPVNRAFYRSEGLDMADFDSRYRALRRRVAGQAVPGHLFVVDMYDEPALDAGFEDRMHADEYGHHQLAEALAAMPEYRHFIESVRAYYGSTGAGHPGS